MSGTLLAASLLFALLDPALAAEVRLGPEKALIPLGPLAPAESYKSYPSVASNGQDFLVVWADQRRGRGDDIYASRISRDGVSTQPSGRHIAEYSDPAVIASAGGDYVVVYRSYATSSNGCLWAQRLDTDGAPLTAPHALSLTCPGEWPLSLTSNGTNYLLLIEGSVASAGRAILLDRDGAPLRTLWTEQGSPMAVGVHGGNYIVVDYAYPLSDGSTVTIKPVLHSISDTGAVADTPLPSIATTFAYEYSGHSGFPAVFAFSSDRILIAWHSEGDALEFLQTGYDGLPVQGPTIIDPKVAQSSQPFAAYWNGGEFEIAYSRGPSDVSIARVIADGTVVSATPFVLTSHGDDPEFVTAGGVQMIVWRDKSARGGIVSSQFPGYDIMARAFTSLDSILAAPDQGNLISWSGIAQENVNVARNGDYEIAVWSDRTDRIFASVNGVPVSINGVPVLIAPRQAGGFVELPAVGSSNSNFLIVWHDGAGPMLAERVAFDGRVLDNPPIVLSANAGALYASAYSSQKTPTSIASDGSTYLVSWSRFPFDDGVITARVESDGTTHGPAALGDVTFVLGGYTFRYEPFAPQVSWTGDRFFVGYSLAYLGFCDPPCSGPYAISGTALDMAGQPSPPKSPSVFYVSGDLLPGYQPQALAFGAGKGTFVWGRGSSVVMAQTTAEGTLIAGPRVILDSYSANGCASMPAIGWDGAELVMAWADSCASVVRAVRLNQFGDPIEAPFDVAADVPPWSIPYPAAPPSIVPTSEGVVIVYSRSDPANGDAPRAFERSLARLPSSLPRRRVVTH